MAKVTDLRHGDLVTNGGMSAVHITHIEHPAWPVLMLVAWRLQDGTVSLDALSPDQEVGDVAEATLAERQDRLVDAVRHSVASACEPGRDPVPALARLAYDAMQDPMLYGFREHLRDSLRIGTSSTIAEIEERIRETVPRG